MKLTSILWYRGPLNTNIRSMQQKAGLSVKHWKTFRSLVQKECEKIRVTDFDSLRESEFLTMRDLVRDGVLAKVNAALVHRQIRPVDEDTAEWATYAFLNGENAKLRRQRIATSWLSKFTPGHTPDPDSAWKLMIETIRATMHDLGLLRTARYSVSERQQIMNEARRRWRSEYNTPEPDEEVIASLITQQRGSYAQQEQRKAERRKRGARTRRRVPKPDDTKESS